jgi:hypothetical protein
LAPEPIRENVYFVPVGRATQTFGYEVESTVGFELGFKPLTLTRR